MAVLPYVLPFVLGNTSWTANASLTVTAASSPAIKAAFASPDIDLVVIVTLTDAALRNATVVATDPQPTATPTSDSLHVNKVDATQPITVTSSPVLKLSAPLADIDTIGLVTLAAAGLRNATVDSPQAITVTPTAVLKLSGNLNTSLGITDTPSSETAETRVLGGSLTVTTGLIADSLRTANVDATQSISATESLVVAAQFLLTATSLSVTVTPTADSARTFYVGAALSVSAASEPVMKFSAFADSSLTITPAVTSSPNYSTKLAAPLTVVANKTGTPGVGFVDGASLSVTTIFSAATVGGLDNVIISSLSVTITLSAEMMLSGVMEDITEITVTITDDAVSNQIISAPLLLTGEALADQLSSDVLLTSPLQVEVDFDQDLFRQIFADTPMLESTVAVQVESQRFLYADAELDVTAVFSDDSQRFMDIDAELAAIISAEEEALRNQTIDCFLASMIDTPTAEAVNYHVADAFIPFFYAGGSV